MRRMEAVSEHSARVLWASGLEMDAERLRTFLSPWLLMLQAAEGGEVLKSAAEATDLTGVDEMARRAMRKGEFSDGFGGDFYALRRNRALREKGRQQLGVPTGGGAGSVHRDKSGPPTVLMKDGQLTAAGQQDTTLLESYAEHLHHEDQAPEPERFEPSSPVEEG